MVAEAHAVSEDESSAAVEKSPAMSSRDKAAIKPVWAGIEVKQAPKLNEFSPKQAASKRLR